MSNNNLIIALKSFSSRLLVCAGKYKDFAETDRVLILNVERYISPGSGNHCSEPRAYGMKPAIMLLLTSVVLVLCPPARAADGVPQQQPAAAQSALPANLWLNPGFLSYHIDRSAGFRSENWGIGLQSNLRDNVSVLGGTYINSDYRRSHYAGVAWQPFSWHDVKIGMVGGLLEGYPLMRNGGWFAAAMPWVSIRGERFGVNLTYFPNFPHGVHAAFVAQFILRIW